MGDLGSIPGLGRSPRGGHRTHSHCRIFGRIPVDRRAWRATQSMGSQRVGHDFRLVKVMVFPVVMHGWESWTVKKAEHRRIDAFELWCWRKLLRVPWTARRSNQSILKEIRPGCSLEGMMLKLKLQYFGHLM